MSSKSLVESKFFRSALIVLLLITSITYYILNKKEKTLRIYTQEELSKTIVKKRFIENKLEDTIIAKKTVQKELNTEKRKRFALETEIEEKEEQIRLSLSRLQKEIVARRETEAQLVITMKEKGILEAKISKLTKKTGAFELERIVVKTTPILVGRVLMVNREYDFIVADLGRGDNVKLGDVLSVYRNEKFIARVQVERLEENICAAAVLPGWQNVEFNESDEVREV